MMIQVQRKFKPMQAFHAKIYQKCIVNFDDAFRFFLTESLQR